MQRKQIIEKIPESFLRNVSESFISEGYHVEHSRQTDGTWTVTAIDNTCSKEQVVNIKKELGEGYYHTEKRQASFHIVDSILNCCMKNECPILNDELHIYLIDISVSTYINWKSYCYSVDCIGDSDVNRYCMAKERALRIFSCPIRPSLSHKIFDHDAQDMKCNPDNIKRRKAYWAYMSRMSAGKPGNSSSDYQNSDKLVTEMFRIYIDSITGIKTKDLERLERLLLNNLDMVNFLDMYRYCFIRQCMSSAL